MNDGKGLARNDGRPIDAPQHMSDCAVHNAPAYEPGPCDCGAISHNEPKE